MENWSNVLSSFLLLMKRQLTVSVSLDPSAVNQYFTENNWINNFLFIYKPWQLKRKKKKRKHKVYFSS